MDKYGHACYTMVMQRIRTRLIQAAALTGLVLPGAAWADGLSSRDVEGMYVQARAMLEDRSIQNVEGVPMLLETSAREGHAEAMLLLLDVYEGRFKGLDANREKAAHQARTLAESPSMDFKVNGGRGVRTESMYRLALYLEDGTGCSEDKQEAFKWMEQAARRGMPQAKVELARYLMNGTGATPDPERAWKLLHEQALSNPRTPNVFFYMGHMCERGTGTRRNLRNAFELYRLGARLNDSRCLNNLGAMFERGIPTPRDPETALRLYRKAANLGNREASANMQRLAFKEGIRANNLSATPASRRIDNATRHLLRALPVTEESRQRLGDWLLITPDPDES